MVTFLLSSIRSHAGLNSITPWMRLLYQQRKHFGRFGAPHQLRSDNGPHFVAEVIREFLMLIGTNHCLTLAYSKEENALVEKMNKEINRHLRALTFENKSLEKYADSLPFVQRILNSNHSDRLKISAAQLLLATSSILIVVFFFQSMKDQRHQNLFLNI